MASIPASRIFDGHNDTLLRLYLAQRNERGGQQRSFFSRSDIGHVDLPRAREGGLGGGFFAIFVPPPPELRKTPKKTITETGYEIEPFPAIDPAYAHEMTHGMMAELFEIEAASEGQVQVVRTADELQTCLETDVFAAILHIEGAEVFDANLMELPAFYEAGLRSLGIVWSRPNIFGHGVPFRYPHLPDTGPGLTDPGKALVRACNELGILIDLSHLNERGFWDVADLTDVPLVATHTGAHAVSPTTRNLTDKQIDAIGETDGVIGITFGVSDLRPDGRDDVNTPVTAIVRHVQYISERIGVEHVAIGSDFDGNVVPESLGDAAGLPRLVKALQEAGFDDAALRKVTHENWLRVLRATWK